MVTRMADDRDDHNVDRIAGERSAPSPLTEHDTGNSRRDYALGSRKTPTGSGKTVIGAALIAEAVAARKHVVFIVHRRELTEQTSAKLHAVGVDHGIVQAGFVGAGR